MVEYSDDDLERFAQNDSVLPKLIDARRRGDQAEEERLMREIIYPAESLLGLKETLGADWIREKGIRTDEADRKYGKGWLDRDVSN